MDNTNAITVDAIWAKLTKEEKDVFKQAQKKAVEKAKAQAKKKNTKRLLDDEDRKHVRDCLKKVGCDSKIALNDVRAIALRWVLDNQAEAFGRYIQSLRKA